MSRAAQVCTLHGTEVAATDDWVGMDTLQKEFHVSKSVLVL